MLKFLVGLKEKIMFYFALVALGIGMTLSILSKKKSRDKLNDVRESEEEFRKSIVLTQQMEQEAKENVKKIDANTRDYFNH